MSDPNTNRGLSRRRFLKQASAAAVAGAAGHRLAPALLAKQTSAAAAKGKAKNCIMIWLGGGMGQIDTFDPKRIGDPRKNIAGAAYPSIPTSVPDVRVCEHLPKTANLMDRMTAVRTVRHDVIDEHAAAVIRVHTGRPTSGTIQYPSIGSIVSNELGETDALAPAYVVVGYPNISRNPGFLGPEAGYLYVTDTESGPNGLARLKGITDQRQSRRERLLNGLREDASGKPFLDDYDAMLSASLRLAGPEFMNTFQLDREPAELREAYGGEFGQRCLLARRLVERGVRFVEVSHNLNFINGTGWDVHNEGLLNQHILIRELDDALAALLLDLDRRNRLDETLVVVGTEFGRPADFDSGGGRGHYGKCFSMVLAGGGLSHRGVLGQTDDLAQEIVEDPVSVPDFHATVFAALGIDPAKELFADNRPVPITDGGTPLKRLFV